MDQHRQLNPKHRRDPEDRPVSNRDELREKALDKTIADSFPASDPPSSLPAPSFTLEEDEEDAHAPAA